MMQSTDVRRGVGDKDEEKVEMSASEAGDSNVKTVKTDGSYADFIDIFKVNGEVVQAPYDTGATKAALKRDLVKPDQYTNKSV